MTFKLNDLKRNIAESTHVKIKLGSSNFSVSKMIEESKTTLRSTEPYIGGERETGERIHRNRDKSRELMGGYHNRSVQNHSVKKDNFMNSNLQKKVLISNSIEATSVLNTSTMKILENSRLETAENVVPAKLHIEKKKARPVSAYSYSKISKVMVFS